MTEQQIMSVEEALEKMTEYERDCLTREICLMWNVNNSGDEWDYSCGIVDSDLKHDEVEGAIKLANETGAKFFIRPFKTYSRLVSSLEFAAKMMLKPVLEEARATAVDDEWLDELISGDNDRAIEIVLAERRVATWDPVALSEASEYLFEGRGLELLKRGQQIAEELDVESENWSSEGLCELARVDNPHEEPVLRILQAMLISAHDPALASRNPPKHLAIGRALDQFNVALRAFGHEMALKYQRDDGMSKEAAEAQAQEDLDEIESRAETLYDTMFDYT